MLVSGYWIVNGSYPYFIPAKDGIFDQHQVASILPLLAQTLILKIFSFAVSASCGELLRFRKISAANSSDNPFPARRM
jgi:hypothetical protein